MMRLGSILLLALLLGGCQALNPKPVTNIPTCPSDIRYAERDLSGEHRFDTSTNVYLQENGELCVV